MYNHYRVIVWVAVLNSVLNVLFNYVFSKWFGVWGIALSTSVTLLILISVYFVYLQKQLKLNLFRDKNYHWISRFIVVSCLAGILEFIFIQQMNRLFEIDFFWNGLVIVMSVFILAGLLYIFKVIRIINRKIII